MNDVMKDRSTVQTSTLALALAAAMGILGDRLLWSGPHGVGFAVWITLLGAAAVWFARRSGVAWVPAIIGWSVVAAAAAISMVFVATEVLHVGMWLVLGVAASMVLLRSGGVRLGETRPAQHVLGLAMVPARAAVGIFPLLGEVELPDGSPRRRLTGVVRGALVAAPLLVVFGALFSSADAAFDRYAVRMATFVSEDLLLHLGLTLLFGWIAAGLLSGVRPGRLPDPLARVKLPRLGADETATALGLLCLLFLAFVALQLGYLFGGRDTIEATSGLTLAEYARRGFFELMVVSLFTVAVLMAGDAVSSARRVFRVLAGVLVACVLVILVSAAQRLALYTGEFGLTLDRITAAVVMAWVAVVLMLFAATVIRERPKRFASGAVVAGIAAVFALVLMDPAALAARSNLDRAVATGEADVEHLLHLGADAVPALVARIDALPAEQACRVAAPLLARWVDAEDVAAAQGLDDWRTWNAARAAARDAVAGNAIELRAVAAACG